jgi:hypothetical protein
VWHVEMDLELRRLQEPFCVACWGGSLTKNRSYVVWHVKMDLELRGLKEPCCVACRVGRCSSFPNIFRI